MQSTQKKNYFTFIEVNLKFRLLRALDDLDYNTYT